MTTTEIAKVVAPKDDLTLEQYKLKHKESIEHPEQFWAKQAKEHLPSTSMARSSMDYGKFKKLDDRELET